MPPVTRLVIDTDPGVDDAHALLLAFSHPQANVEALTTVCGNVPLIQTTRNACTILDIVGKDIPVYAGCDRPLIVTPHHAIEFHGQDGLGNAGYSPSPRAVEREHAVHALIRLANVAPGELTLVGIGPLTNIALATRLDPTLPSKYKQLVVMGGAIHGRGNATPAAEFNFYADPEAAAIVFAAWPDLTLISWETTVAHSVSPPHVEILMAAGSPHGEFLRRITRHTLEITTRIVGERCLFQPDLLAIAAALEPEIVTQSAHHYVQIELSGQHTRGQTVVDWYGRTGNAPNTHLVLDMDRDRLWELLQIMVA